MAKVSPPPELISEHGLGQVTVKSHSRKTPNRKTPPKAPPKGPAVATGTPASTVDDQVTAAQLPEKQSIEDAQKASAEAAKAQAITTQGYYAALANALKSIGPATQAGYQSAAADTSAFGKGFSDGLAHVQSQTQDESNNIAGIAGGQAQQAPGGAPDALYALGGYIPATGLAREGAAFGAAANQLPATAAGQGASTIAGIGRQQAIDQKGFQQKLTDLAAQAPGLRAQYQAQADAQAARAAALRQTQINAENHERDVRRQQAISMIIATGVGPDGKLTPRAQADLARALGYDPVTLKPTASTVIAQGRLDVAKVNANNAAARLTLAQQKALSDMYGVDADGNLTLPGRRAALAQWKAEHPASKGGFTQNQLKKIKGDAGKQAENYRYGSVVYMKDPNNPLGPMIPNDAKSISSIPDYQTALSRMVSQGVPLSIAQNALNQYWPLGNGNKGKTDEHGSPLPYGRPYLSAQQRAALGGNIDPFAIPTDAQVAALRKKGMNYNGPTVPYQGAPPAGHTSTSHAP